MSFTKSKYLKFAILIISICFLIGVVSACLPLNLSLPELTSDTLSETAITITTNASDGLGEFKDGYSYVYTDKDLITKFRAGDVNTEFDVTIHNVAKTSGNRGTQDNPYVIASVEDWNRFAKNLDDGTIASYGSNQFFVLANDIDFNGEKVYPIRYFNGTFYGMGHTLENVTIDGTTGWVYWNKTSYAQMIGTASSYGYSIFCRITNATITDLILQDYHYIDIPDGPSFNSSRNSAMGGIVGLTSGINYVLNCHATGEIISPTVKYSYHVGLGGIVGNMLQGTSAGAVLIYRCSAEIDAEMSNSNTSYTVFAGGIMGEFYAGGTATIYDCVANARITYNAGRWPLAGSVYGTSASGSIVIENTVSTIDYTYSMTGAISALGTPWTGSTHSYKNCYASGLAGTATSKNALYPALASGSTLKGASNVNTAKTTANYAAKYSSASNSLSSSNCKEYSTTSYSDPAASMLADAKTFFSAEPYSRIWDTSKIGGAYTPDESPVRNYLMAFIDFRNVINGGKDIENDVEVVDIEDGVGYVTGDALPSPNSDPDEFGDFLDYLEGKKNNYHEFVGWTDDPKGDGDVFKELPSGMYGALTLYAVWTLPDDYVENREVTVSLTAKDDIVEINYDSVSSITLTALVEHNFDVMQDTSKSYTFYQGGKIKDGVESSVKTSGVLTVKTVADSGEYSFRYRIADGYEPLWYYEGDSIDEDDDEKSVTKKITINKGVLSIDKFEITNDPYFGMEVADVTFTVTVKNSAGISVTLTDASWKNKVETNTVKQGTNTQTLSLVPTDTANYSNPTNINVTFDSVPFYLKFIFKEIAEEKDVEIEYAQNYGPNEIIYLFTTAYMDALANDPNFAYLSDSGLAPYLADEEQVDADPTYRGKPIVTDSSGDELYNTTYNNVTEEITIYVFLKAAKYTVTFNPNSSSNTTTMPAPEEYGYGKFVKKPNDPTNGQLLFVGWYFNEEYKDDQGKIVTRYRAWRFYSETQEDGTIIPQDRVTGNLNLTAEWLSASNLDSVDLVIDPTATFTALDMITNGDKLTVTGNYSGSKDGVKATASKVISYSGYTIQYGILDDQGEFVNKYTTLKVVEDGMYIRVGVRFGATTVYSDPQPVAVDPIDISEMTEQFNFDDSDGDGVVVYDYDGTGKTLPTLSDNYVTSMTGAKITGIEYEYRNAFTNEIVDAPSAIGTYTVTITYTTASPDFYAEPTVITMKIASTIKVKVEWKSTSLMYSGAGQHPVICKIYDAETGAEITVNDSQITYSGDTEATNINIGSHYKVKVSLGDSYTVIDGEECEFDITKALLKIPTYTSGMILYDGTTKVLEEYLGEQFNPLLMKIVDGGTGKEVNTYRATITLTDTINCSWDNGTTNGTIASQQIEWKIEPAILYISWDEWEFVDDGVSAYAPQISKLIGLVGTDSFDFDTDFIYKIYDEDGNLLDVSEVSDIGSYKITASFNGTVKNYTLDSTTKEWSFVVVPKSGMTILTIEWSETSFLYDGEIHYPKPTIKDANNNDVTADVMAYLKFSEGYNTHRDIGTYSVKVSIKDSAADEYFIRSGSTCKFMITDENGYAPDEDETNAGKKDDDTTGSGSLDMDSIMKVLREYWKAIVSGVCILLSIIFLAKAGGYNSRRKRAKKAMDDRYKAYYAGAIGLFGLASSTWTIIMSICIALAVVSFIIMLICKKKCVKAEDELAYAKEDYARNQADVENRRREEEARQRDENMRMMFMNMFGGAAAQGMAPNMAGDGQAQGGYANMQPGIGMADIRGIVSETVTAMLPGVQQALPAQASANDELVQKLIDQNEKLMEKSQKNEAEMRELLKELTKQNSERVVEREVASSSVNDEVLKSLIEGQRVIMEKLASQATQQPIQPQIVEKEVVKEVPVEKIVEKEVVKEVPVEVEKIVEVPVEVEKIVEKEVPVEVIKEVKVEVPVKAEAKPKRDVAPRLTLDEAYALLTKEQKKFFDGLKQYVLDKYKCKEKKTTYFVTYGQTATNPLLKLMIKKNITVAMLKMEDELMKDIRRDATGDGTKVKVKETEILVTDAQAFDTAKKMIDLRYDQIERYQDLLKEQRAMRK